MRAYEEAIAATSTQWAPWYVVPADHKWVTRAVVAHTIAEAVRNLNPEYPEVGPEKQTALKAARKQLEDEKG